MPEIPLPRYLYVLDCYLYISANTKEEADTIASEAKEAVEAREGVYLELFDAYGINDAETGLEIREVK